MAYHKPSNLDGFITQMVKSDMRIKASLAEDLVIYLSDSENSIECSDLGLLIDGLIPWMTGSHFKIAQRALEAFTELIGRLGHDFNAYTSTILPHVLDRLGDSRDTVREKAQLLLHKLMECRVVQPQVLIDKLTVCFKHKNAKVREEFLQTIVNALNEHGTQSLSVKTYIQPIVILLGDPTPTVRDAAVQTLVEIYKHVGDKLRTDLRKKDVPVAKMVMLEDKFNEARNAGLLLPSATCTAITNDETDTALMPRPSKLVKRTPSATPRKPMYETTSSGDLAAGAVSPEIFEASFENVPALTIFSQRDMDEFMKTINAVIGDKNMDWDKRVDALKKIRSLLMVDIQSNSSFPQQLKDLSIAFLDILKELRSQVIREACITLAYMSKVLKNRLDQFCIYILQELINLIQNSAKVISSSGIIALKYVIRFTHAPKLLPIITQNLLQSKSKDIRSTLSELMSLIFEEWPTKQMERSATALRDSLKKGIADADSEARRHARRAFWLYRRHFPELADAMYGGLDPSAQRTLEKERDNSGSNAGFRSVSAVDTAAAQRARARAQYSNLARLKVTSGTASLQGQYAQQARAKKTPLAMQHQQQPQQSPERIVRSRAGVSQSQPTSRSTSPSNRLKENFSAYNAYRTGTVPKKTSGIPRSLANSRETSPTRNTQFGSLRRNMYTGNSSPRRPPLNPGRPVLAQKILQQSREAESALADALSPDEHDLSADFSRIHLHRKMSRDESDEGSEASSVCSERSFDSFRRGNDSASWNGSRTRLDSSRPIIEDIETIIQFCASTHWSERKDGLISLTQYLSEGRMLTPHQLQCVLDLFRKMFMDPHIKVYALFLDTVNELILSHSNDLHDWLFILLTRLFNKLGTDLLASMNSKIWKTLQLIYEYFPADLQMQCVFRILVDAAQTPNVKARQAALKFLTSLATTYCLATHFQIQILTQSLVERAITKIIQTTLDQKSVELKSQARSCVVALYNCNPSQMTMALSNLPKQLQDTARAIIQQHMRRSNSGTNSPSSPLSCSSPKPLVSPQQGGPYSLQNNASQRSRQSSVENPGNDHMNTEEIYKNLRKTTAEIQNYSFESKLDRDTNSKDSGISQMGDHTTHIDSYMSANGLNGHLKLESNDSCNGSKTQSATTTESNTPENTVRMDSMDLSSKMASQALKISHSFTDSGDLIVDGVKEGEVLRSALALTNDTNPETVVQVLNNLQVCIKIGNCEQPIKQFKSIMKMLLNIMESQSNSIVMTAALRTLGKILRSEKMRPCWTNFLELILLKIIDCYKFSKEVAREIEIIIYKIAPVLPLDTSINILNPVIATGEFPSNICALKILTDLTDKQGKDLTDNHLDIIMPNIARLADDSQSTVRKAAVFCIVKLYITMGEDKVKPKFALLNSSKIRLLNVYIQKSMSSKAS